MYLVMRRGLVLRLFTFACALACAVVFAAPAGASQLIARNASNITLQVNSKGKALITYKAGRRVTVHLRGGDLEIEWRAEDNHVYLTGPAQEVFEGTIEI